MGQNRQAGKSEKLNKDNPCSETRETHKGLNQTNKKLENASKHGIQDKLMTKVNGQTVQENGLQIGELIRSKHITDEHNRVTKSITGQNMGTTM